MLLAGYLGALLLLLLTSRAPVYGEPDRPGIPLPHRCGLRGEPVCGAGVLPAVRRRRVQPGAEPAPARPAGPDRGPRRRWSSWSAPSVWSARCGRSATGTATTPALLRAHPEVGPRSHGAVDLADQPVPDAIYPATFAPDNSVRRLVSLVSDRAAFPDASPRLTVVGADGGLRQAAIKPGVVSDRGPVPDCGWPVTSAGRTIPLTGKAFEWVWWLRIGYLANQASPVRVSTGSDEMTTTVEPGVNSLYVKLAGTFDSVRIDGLDPGARLCVDTIEVGQPVPGAVLP